MECDLSYSRLMLYIWLYMLYFTLWKKKKGRKLNQSRKQKRAMGNRWMMTSKEWHEKLKKRTQSQEIVILQQWHLSVIISSTVSPRPSMKDAQMSPWEIHNLNKVPQQAMERLWLTLEALSISCLILAQDLKSLYFFLITTLSISVVT